jgi:hypothetical protein
VLELPYLHQIVSAYIIHFLQNVSMNAEKNKMTIHNLATVWAPILFKPPPADQMQASQSFLKMSMDQQQSIATLNSEFFQETAHSVELLKLLISKREEIFKQLPPQTNP